MQAMIFAAGLGTRLKPWTNYHPKALAIVKGKSLLQHNVEYLQNFGIKDIVVNVHHFAQQIINLVNEHNGWGSNIVISDETAMILETGGGLVKAAPLLTKGNCFIAMNVDILTDLRLDEMITLHTNSKALVTLATTNRNSSRYFMFDENDKLCGWKNEATGEEKIARASDIRNKKAFSGVHLINTSIFDMINKTGKFSIVDTYLEPAIAQAVQSHDHSGGRFIDVGKPESVIAAEEMFFR